MPQYNFTYSFKEFQATREQANAHKGNIYYVADRFKDGNFGIAHGPPLNHQQGNGSALLPVRVDASKNYEPKITDGSQERPPSIPFTLTVT